MSRVKVAFVCVHNSCRSQMAEALANILTVSSIEAYSAGTELVDRINQDAVSTIKDIYGVDMEETQKSKLITDLPEVDVVVTMGCNVNCPNIYSKHREDWGLEDPTGQDIEQFYKLEKTIKEKLLDLEQRILNKEILV